MHLSWAAFKNIVRSLSQLLAYSRIWKNESVQNQRAAQVPSDLLFWIYASYQKAATKRNIYYAIKLFLQISRLGNIAQLYSNGVLKTLSSITSSGKKNLLKYLFLNTGGMN